MIRCLLLAIGLLPSLACAAASPVVYAPDVVGVERMFMVGLKVPQTAPEVTVAAPECMTMFDHQRPPFASDVRRFYFRALKPASKAEIRFALPDGEVVVPVEIWSFEDLRKFRTLKGKQLPRRWPLGEPLPELKEKQIFPTGAEAKTRTPPEPGSLGESDEKIWAM
ncbi:MAG: hypothetical protein FJ388_18500, partial [Verrucomicrobia bacterium]|nr:hypothetical protein [Verrucomicrobiota bacterium]